MTSFICKREAPSGVKIKLCQCVDCSSFLIWKAKNLPSE